MQSSARRSSPIYHSKSSKRRSQKKDASITEAVLGKELPPFLSAASSQCVPLLPYAPYAGPSSQHLPSISSPCLTSSRSLHSNNFAKASGSCMASKASRAMPLHRTCTLASTRVFGDPWYVVLRGHRPGAYGDR